MFYPFTTVKKYPVNFTGDDAVIFTPTTLTLVVFRPSMTAISDGQIYVQRDISGFDPYYRIFEGDALATGTRGGICGAMLVEPGEPVKMSAFGGTAVRGTVYAFELPDDIA